MSALCEIFFYTSGIAHVTQIALSCWCVYAHILLLFDQKKKFFLLIGSFRLEKTFQMFSLTVSHVYVLNLFFCFPDLWAL